MAERLCYSPVGRLCSDIGIQHAHMIFIAGGKYSVIDKVVAENRLHAVGGRGNHVGTRHE